MKKSKKPRIVAMLGQKGGSGKTTLAVHVGVAAQQDGQGVGILDTDPQANAHAWVGYRENQDPAVVSITPDQVDECLEIAEEKGLSLIVIDTAPHATTNVYNAIKRADLVLMPCRPSILDLSTIEQAVAIAKGAKRPSAFVLNGCPPRAPEVASTRAALETYPFPVAPVTIGNRQAFIRAMASGLSVTEFDPKGLAAEEMRQLWMWIQGAFN